MSPISPQLLSRFLREHGPALVLYAQQWCPSPEDVVQEAFWQLAEQSQAPENVVAWLYRVVRNGALNAARGVARRQRHESAAADRDRRWFEPGDDDRLDARLAAQSLAGLPEAQREAIVARLWGGLSFEEIGRLADCSTTTAFRRYQAGIETLRERLGAPCPKSEENPKS